MEAETGKGYGTSYGVCQYRLIEISFLVLSLKTFILNTQTDEDAKVRVFGPKRPSLVFGVGFGGPVAQLVRAHA